MRKPLLAGAVVFAATLLAGCGHGYGYGYAQNGPPPPRYYGSIGVAPGPGYVWTSGYWDRRGNNWAWAEGRWVRPPHARAVWVAPEWRHEGRQWRLRRGHWR